MILHHLLRHTHKNLSCCVINKELLDECYFINLNILSKQEILNENLLFLKKCKIYDIDKVLLFIDIYSQVILTIVVFLIPLILIPISRLSNKYVLIQNAFNEKSFFIEFLYLSILILITNSILSIINIGENILNNSLIFQVIYLSISLFFLVFFLVKIIINLIKINNYENLNEFIEEYLLIIVKLENKTVQKNENKINQILEIINSIQDSDINYSKYDIIKTTIERRKANSVNFETFKDNLKDIIRNDFNLNEFDRNDPIKKILK